MAQETIADKFYDEIQRQLANKDDGGTDKRDHCHPFLPLNSPAFPVPTAKVEEILRSISKLDTGDIPDLTRHVTEKAMQVFLTLACIGQVKQIKALHQANFADRDLPICSRDTEAGRKVYRLGVTGQTTGKSLDHFQRWTSRKVNDFLKAQWIFLAPKFRKAQFEDSFHPDCPLPFEPTRNKIIHKGLSGVVQQLYLRVEHLDDEHQQSLRPVIYFTPAF